MRQFLLAGFAAGAFLGVSSAAHATFIIDPNPGGIMFFNGDANKNVSSFDGTVGGQHSGPVVTVSTVGNVDTGAGFSNITPVKDSVLTQLTFTPADPTLFNDFSFRGQLERAGFSGTVDVTVTDNQGNPSQTLTFTGLAGPDADFDRIGIVSNDGETIKSVVVSTPGTETFKEFKQVEFSPAGTPVPEPASLLLLGSGLVGLGLWGRRSR